MTNKKRFLMLIGLPVLVAISTACEAAEPDQKNIQGRVWSDTDADGIQMNMKRVSNGLLSVS